ncbi:MAG TPA: DUF4175 family protein, partial [Firmicutes bacterium]|nr:DUF4175 family protein [Bacillota bacterium]
MEDFKRLLKKFQALLIIEHFFSGLLFFIIIVEISILLTYFFLLEFSRRMVFSGFFLGIIILVVEFTVNLIRFLSRFRVAKFIEKNNPELKDYVTTTLSLSKDSLKYYSEDLINKALSEATKTIKERNPLFRTGERTSFISKLSILGLVLFLLISAVIPYESYQRIEYLYTGKVFLKPGSNILLSRYGGKIIEGDEFNFDIIPLKEELREIAVYTVNSSGEKSVYRNFSRVTTNLRITFSNCREPFSYEIRAEEQFHGPYYVDLVKRPNLDDISVFVTPPEYTGLKSYHSNSGNIRAAEGSKILMTVNFNKEIIKSRIEKLNKNGKVSKKTVQFDFELRESMTYSINAFDSDGIVFDSNIFNLEVIPDSAPIVKIVKPGQDLRLKNATEKIQLEIFTEDDYGLTSAKLVFSISDYDQRYTIPLKDYSSHTKTDRIFFTWPLSIIQLKADDFVSYYVEVTDNKEPMNTGVSQTFVISFKDMKEQLEEFVEHGEDMINA